MAAIYVDPERDYQRGLDLLQKQKYGAAQIIFSVIDSKENISEEARANSAFVGKCASELFNEDAEYLLLDFMKNIRQKLELSACGSRIGIVLPYRLKRYKEVQSNGWRKSIGRTWSRIRRMKCEFQDRLCVLHDELIATKPAKAFLLVKDGKFEVCNGCSVLLRSA
ncbi:MAG: hypothetical protein IPP51_15955 [Bacteroidetes bacterium]|nr:hypothetical protein [Bacteroidota bacterium]